MLNTSVLIADWKFGWFSNDGREQKFCSLKVEKEKRFVLVFNSVMVCLLIRVLLILVALQQILQYPHRSKNNTKNITC